MVELCYNFFDKQCDVIKFEKLEMNTDSLYLALSEHDLYVLSDQQGKKSGTLCEVVTVRMNSQPTQQKNSSLVLAALSTRRTIDENLGYSKKYSAEQKWFAFVAKLIAVMAHNQRKSNLAAKV